MAQITIPDEIKEGEVIDVTHINSFIEQMNDIGGTTTSINGSNIRNEGIDRRNILRDQVQRTGEDEVVGTWFRSGPIRNESPPVWKWIQWGNPSPAQLGGSAFSNAASLGYVTGGTGPALTGIPVEAGDKLLITCSFAFSVFPLDTNSNDKSNTDPNGGYGVIFRLSSPNYYWPGTTRWFNTIAVSNAQGGGYRPVPTQNTCTIVGYKEYDTKQNINVFLQASCRRSKKSGGNWKRKDNILRIKSFHIFAKIVRK